MWRETYEGEHASAQRFSGLRSLGYLPIARRPGTLHRNVALEWSISKRIDFMRRRTASSPISSSPSGIIPVEWHRDRRRRQNPDAFHVRRKDAGLSRSTSRENSRNPLQWRGLTTANGTDDFFHTPGGKGIHTRSIR